MRSRAGLFLIALLIVLVSSTVQTAARQTEEFEYLLLDSDTLRVHKIRAVTITSTVNETNEKSTSPLQALHAVAIQQTAAGSISDAARFFSGVQVKDYGGLGGMKTISVRSLGAQHTAVSYDGLVLTDCQTGQMDLGKFSLENVEMLSLNIGDGNHIFQPARAFASSSMLTIRTKKPFFAEKKNFKANIRAQMGSFAAKDFSVNGAYKLSPKASLSLSTQWQNSEGDYPYRLYYGDGAQQYQHEVRANNAMTSLRVESMLAIGWNTRSSMEVKTYHYDSQRQLPGAVILYNPQSNQKLWDQTDFIQSHFEKNWSNQWSWQFNAKYNQTSQRYLNPDYLGSSGREDFRYHQQEGYLSSALLFQPTASFSVSWATDGAVAGMQSNLSNFSTPTRFSLLSNAAVKYVQKRFLATAGLLATGIKEQTKQGQVAQTIGRLSPALNASWQPFSTLSGLRIRSFWKASFRLPSFNDLYYSAIGNTSLKPENNQQINWGLTYVNVLPQSGVHLDLTVDAFQNQISNKIMAIPTKNIFVWSMTNLGKVDIQGLDLNLHAAKELFKTVEINTVWNHSYQRALDKTDPSSKVYGQQIAYAPRVYGSIRYGMDWKHWLFGYTMLYSGHRYVTGQNLAINDMPGYQDHSLSLAYQQKAVLDWTLRLDVQNLSNKNYEIVRNFPMPGRMMKVTLQLDL